MSKVISPEYAVLDFARRHYENFPVISFLVPKEFRTDIAAIYWFARSADDLADEGNFTAGQRLENLAEFETAFHQMLTGESLSAYHEILYNVIKKRNLSTHLFTDLISAFKQDVIKKRYNDYPEVSDYCRRSANPVGRLLLEMFNIRNDEAFLYSDKICTALQLTNFYQDTTQDFMKGRIYFPEDEMRSFGVSEKSFEMNEINDNLIHLVKFNMERTEHLYADGRKLLPFLKGRFRLEIKWTIEGGLSILRKIEKNKYNIFIRPHLSKYDFAGKLIKSLLK